MDLNIDFLNQENWPVFGQGNHSPSSKMLHEWCGKISQFVLTLSNRVKELENKKTFNIIEINKLKSDLDAANNASKTLKATNICSDWVNTVTRGSKIAKKPAEQLTVTNAAINEMKERERRKKNVIIYGVPESTKEVLSEKKADDECKFREIMHAIDKPDVKPMYLRRLRSKDSSKPH